MVNSYNLNLLINETIKAPSPPQLEVASAKFQLNLSSGNWTEIIGIGRHFHRHLSEVVGFWQRGLHRILTKSEWSELIRIGW